MSLLQSFPESYTYVGSRASVAKQIDNAVPCGLAAALGRGLAAALVEDDTRPTKKQRGGVFEP